MGVSSYRELRVWQTGMELTRQVYQLTHSFPNHEMYGLRSQMQRAAVSIPANIAEGHARDSTKELLHHISIARGSLAELETFLILAQQLDYCEQDSTQGLLQTCDEESRMLSGLRASLEKKIGRDG
jgi:four helix bundle protein